MITSSHNKNATTDTTAESVSGTQSAQPQQRASFSFHEGSVFSRAPLGRGIGSEALIKCRDALAEEYKAADSSFEITLIPLDNANEASHFSCVVVCVRDKLAGKQGIAVHTLLLEDTGEPIQPRTENINGSNVEILRVPGDAYDSVLTELISTRVRAAFPNVTLYNALATVVPRGFNYEDRTAIHKLAENTARACATELKVNNDPQFKDFNLANLTPDSKLIVAMSFSRNQSENAVGRPIRADVDIAFSSQQTKFQGQQAQSLNSDERSVTVSRATAFLDLIYAPVMPQNQGFYGAYQPAPMYGQAAVNPTQLYSPRLILTSLESNYATTIGTQLMALLTTQAVAADNNWMQGFRPVPSINKRTQMHDIGAVGIEFPQDGAQFGKRIDTSADSFRPEQLAQLLSTFIRPGLVLSMDIPECDAETCYQSDFSAAANGNANACEALYYTADQLTNGNFNRLFAQNAPMFTDLGNRVHLGHYTDENGNKRDIRDCDYLAVANMIGERDPAAIRDWSDTFVNGRYQLAQRLAARKRIIQGLLPDAVFTGFAHRVTFRQDFLTALSQAAKDAGLSMAITTPMNTGELNNQRGVAGFVVDAMSNLQASPVFSADMGNMFAGSSYSPFSNQRRF